MGESTGQVVFVNSHDYVSDVTGTEAVGCMVSMRTDEGAEVVLYTRSLRLQQTLEMAYAAKARVAVDYVDAATQSIHDQQRLMDTAAQREPDRPFSGPFNLKAVWTLEG